MHTIKIVIKIAILNFIIINCSSLDLKNVPKESNRIIENVQIVPSYDVFLIRLDIFRQFTTTTTTSTNAQGQQVTTTQTVPVPYHYIGVDLGNGLFLDARLNLSINLLKFANLQGKDSFKIIKKGSGFFSSDTTYEKKNNKATITVSGLFGSETEIEFKKNGATFKGGFLTSDQDIMVTKNKITYDPHSIIGSWAVTEVEKTANGAKIPNFWSDKEMTLSNNVAKLPSNFYISRKGKELEIKYESLFSDKVFRFVQSKTRIMIFNEDAKGVQIDYIGNIIKVQYSGMAGIKDHEFEIIKVSN